MVASDFNSMTKGCNFIGDACSQAIGRLGNFAFGRKGASLGLRDNSSYLEAFQGRF